MKKVYIWNDLKLMDSKNDVKKTDKYLNNIKRKIKSSSCKLEILESTIINKYLKEISILDNIVTIGTRPSNLISKDKKSYNISSKRKIAKTGFASSCNIEVDDSLLELEYINIIEDIVVTGTTLTTILDYIISKRPNMKINIYLLIGYKDVLAKINSKYKNINIVCFNLLMEKSITESTCVFLSDLLYEKLGENTYLEHFKNKDVFGNQTAKFISEIENLKTQLQKKVGIVTITIGINYGNRLQNYALQEVIKNFGYSVETFENIYQEKKLISKISRNISLFKKKKKFKQKLNKFKLFNEKYIKFSKYKVKSFNTSNKIAKNYSYLVCGSDQIWNMNYIGNSKCNFLTFAPIYKRIAYAPSISSDSIPSNRIEEFSSYLKKINKLSCRELEGSKLIKKLSNRDCKTVLDPTLLLSREEWDKIACPTNSIEDKKYILTYFLGGITKEYNDYIKKIEKKYKMKIINISEESNFDPSEFLYLISKASLICTDSYHGLIFSLIYKKPYILFERLSNVVSMNSRFSSIHKLLKLPNRNYNKITENNIFNIDYTPIYINIKKHQEESINYLKDSIGDISG